MGYEEEYSRLAWSPKATSGLTTLLADVGPLALSMSGAQMARFEVTPVLPGHAPFVYFADDDTRSDIETALKSTVLTQPWTRVGQVSFHKASLTWRGETFGSLTLAFCDACGNDLQPDDNLADIAKLVSVQVSQNIMISKLELSLAETNQRVLQLAKTADKDPLTEVTNKAAFERLARARLANLSEPAAFIAFDLDGFKQVNDIYGHQFGDTYLKTVADSLKRSFPGKTLIGRTGGDEFCVLTSMPESGRTYMNGLMQQVRAAVQRNVAYLGKPEMGRISVGVSLFPRQSTDYDELFGYADAALYASKRAGRNVTTVFHKSLNVFGDMHVRPSGHDADTFFDQIVPHMQPIVDLESGRCTGFEVLARWRSAEGKVFEPHHFDWVFRDHRMAKRFTRHIVEHAFDAFCAGKRGRTRNKCDMWINVTAFDLLDPEFVFDLQTMLNAYGFGWEDMVIEVSEQTALGENGGQIFRSLEEIRRRGGRVALDDFGTGHAGLKHVWEWPIDIVKIDKSFVQRVSKSQNGDVVISALLEISGRLNHAVVAEGIETPRQLAAIRALGCTYGQGFLFGAARPLAAPIDEPTKFDLAAMANEVTDGA